jgi:hypothetical protein
MSAARYIQRAIDFRWLANQTTDERAQRVLIELAREYEALAAAATARCETLQPAETLGVHGPSPPPVAALPNSVSRARR